MDSQAQIALVTGAGSGIGREVSLALLAEGYRVVLAGRRLDALQETAGLAADWAKNALPIATDVSDPQSMDALFAAIAQTHGRLDLLFNNAGITLPPSPLEDVAFDDWQRLIAINLTGSFLSAQRAVRMMKAQNPRGGRIINNGSISAQTPRPHAVAYGASKHAITGLTKSIGLEGRDFDISCCQIDIGNAAVDRTAIMEKGMLQPDGSRKPEARMGVDTVVKAVLFMASLPLDATVPFITVMATKMPHLGRG